MSITPCSCRRYFTKVLLATDFSAASAAAFEVALKLCHESGASLSILNAFEYASISPPEVGGQMIEFDRFFADAEKSLISLVQAAQDAGVKCEGVVLNGIAHTEILNSIPRQQIDLVVLGTRAIHGLERLVFGSTAEAVLRKAGCPVLTVGPLAAARAPHEHSPGGIVLFATDFHASTTEALGIAATYATLMKLPLHCLNVLPRSVHDAAHKGVIPLIITEALQHLAATFDREQEAPTCAVTYGSEISTAVTEYARKHDARMIVLGVRRASLAASHVPAHITYRVITEAPCPVLTIAYPAAVELIEPALVGALAACEVNPSLPEMVQVGRIARYGPTSPL